jgi:GntR family transcriptional regulator
MPSTVFPASERASDAPSFAPLYAQIKALITQGLQGGQWRPGEPIPSEIELAARYNVSQGTVRKAIDELAAENLLVRRQGKGTFVATHAEEQVQYRFLRLKPDDGPVVPMKRRLLEFKRMRAPAAIARLLQLKTGDAVLFLRRTLSAGERAVVLDDIWLPGAPFKALSAQRIESHAGPLYGLFESEFGVRMVRAEEKIRAVAADAGAASLMNAAVGAPLLSVERLSFTYRDQPVEVRQGLYETSSHHYRNELG